MSVHTTTNATATPVQPASLNAPGSQNSPNVTRLTPLELSQCAQITDAGLQQLAVLRNLVPLNLNLAGTVNFTAQRQLPVGDFVNIEGQDGDLYS